MICRKLRSFKPHICISKRMLNALVHTDGTSKDDAVLSILSSFVQGRISQSYCFGRQKTAFSIHTMQDYLKASTFAADKSGRGDDIIVKEDFIRINSATTHFFDLAQLKAWKGFVKVKEK